MRLFCPSLVDIRDGCIFLEVGMMLPAVIVSDENLGSREVGPDC
jgi:hypothetical protein